MAGFPTYAARMKVLVYEVMACQKFGRGKGRIIFFYNPIDYFDIAGHGSTMQDRISAVVSRLDISSSGQKCIDHFNVASKRRFMKSRDFLTFVTLTLAP